MNEREPTNRPLAIQKRNKTSINLWHQNRICICDQRFLKGSPSSSFASFLKKTWLSPNNWTFIRGENIIKKGFVHALFSAFLFQHLKEGQHMSSTYIFIPITFRYHEEKVNVVYFLNQKDLERMSEKKNVILKIY